MSDLKTKPLEHIRNFAIIAHIDHGKSTLADRLIQTCGGLEEREMSEQVLDNTDIERERGITIKAQTVRLEYTAKDGITYQLNLMDTPGHVDFSYEVSRSLASCEGSILVVDASQGVEAQTLANVYMALDHDHEIVPVINKIDLPAADPERVKQEVEDVIGLDCSEAVHASAKTGEGIEELLEAVVTTLPAPAEGDAEKPTKALLVDSWYDIYLGVVVLVRVMDGYLRPGQKIKFMSNGATRDIDRVGMFTPKKVELDALGPGEMGSLRRLSRIFRRRMLGIRLRMTATLPRMPFQALSRLFRWCFVRSIRRMRGSLRSCGIRLARLSSMMRACILKWKVRKRLGLGFGVGFWASCIWRLFRNGWSGNLIWISFRRRHLWFTKSI